MYDVLLCVAENVEFSSKSEQVERTLRDRGIRGREMKAVHFPLTIQPRMCLRLLFSRVIHVGLCLTQSRAAGLKLFIEVGPF